LENLKKTLGRTYAKLKINLGTLNSREWKTREWKSWHHNAGVEIAGVEFSAPNIRAGKRGSGDLGRRKSMESEAIIIADCIG